MDDRGGNKREFFTISVAQRFTGGILACGIMVALLVAVALSSAKNTIIFAATPPVCESVSSESELNACVSAIGSGNPGATITIANDIEVAAPINLSAAGSNIIMQSNSGQWTLTTSNSSQPILQVSGSGTELTLRDIILDGGGVRQGALLYLTSGGILTLDDGATLRNNQRASFAGTSGGCLTANSGSTINMQLGSTIVNCSAATGGGIYTDSSTVNLTGGTISDNAASSNAGGAYVANGTITLNGDVLIDNNVVTSTTGNSYGGGIYMGNNGVLSMLAGTISNNIVTEQGAFTAGGGGVSGAVTAQLQISGGVISQNSARVGGGVYSSGAVSIGGSVIISSNTASSEASTAYGGGVYLATSASMTLSGGMISDNKVNNNAATSTVSGGGGISVSPNAQLQISGGVISGNKVTSASNNARGGGVYSDSTVTTLFGSGLSIIGGTISGNSSQDGGGIFGNGIISITGGTLSGNHATSAGGGIRVNTSSTLAIGGTAEIIDNDAVSGGGVYYSNNTGSNTIQGHALISENIATSTGGGVFVGANVALDLSGGTISENNAVNGGGVGIGNNGSLIVDSSEVLIADNTATTKGGGISSGTDSVITLSGGTISGNKSVNGGGINAGGDIIINDDDVLIDGNIADNSTGTSVGGGVYLAGSGAVMEMSAGTISNNKVTNSSPGNSSSGGGISFYIDTRLEISGGIISGNSVTNDNQPTLARGGGISSGPSSNPGGVLVITGGIIEGNSAINGGGIYTLNDSATVTGGVINDNTATNGGGIQASGGDLTIGGTAQIIENNGSYGGGLYAGGNATTIIKDSAMINNNIASSAGGGVRVIGSSNLTVQDEVSVSGNSATIAGGAIHFANTGTNIIQGSIQVDGNAAGSGGGTYVSTGSSLHLAGGSLTNNQATSSTAGARGGAIYAVELEALTVDTPVTFSGNTAVEAYATLPSSCTLYNANIHAVSWSVTPHGTPNGVCSAISGGLTGYNNYDIGYAGAAVQKVTFELGSGAFAPVPVVANPQFVANGYPATPPIDPILAGATFAGWYIDGGFVVPHSWGDAISEDKTLYAKYTTELTFDARDGVSPPSVVSIAVGLAFGAEGNGSPSLPVPAASGVVEGYIFDGWWTTASCAASVSTVGCTQFTDESTVSGAMTLYAKWKADINFDANGGTGTMAVVPVVYGGAVTIPGNEFTPPEYYIFDEWNDSPDGGGLSYSAGQTVSAWTHTGGDLTLYAQWVSDGITLLSCNTLDLGMISGINKISSDSCDLTVVSSIGYQLSIGTSNDEMLPSSGGGLGIPPASSGIASPGSLTNTNAAWGFRLDGVGAFGLGPTITETNTNSSSFTWAGVPESDTPLLSTATSSAFGGDDYTAWFAVSSGLAPAGTYDAQVIWTVLANF